MVFSFGLIFNEVHIMGIESQPTGSSTVTVILNDYYLIIGSVMLFCIPSLFMLVCNIKMFMEVRLRGRQLCELFQNSQREQHDKLMLFFPLLAAIFYRVSITANIKLPGYRSYRLHYNVARI